ncbi:MAG: oligosaccharide flippase family protein [Gemmatimonadaceae bacterium]
MRTILSSTLKRNIAANFVGSIFQALVSLAFIPLYLKLLGIESYGLLGFFATLQTMFALLDMGLSATLTRELARLSILSDKHQEMRNLVRSLELVYWGIALLVGFIIIIAAPFFAYHWVKAGNLSPQVIERTIVVMGFAAALQWPSSLYNGGLMGLQRQVLLNSINVGASIFRNVGAVWVLWMVSPTIQVFLVWQAVTSALITGVLALSLWQSLPRGEGPATFQKDLLASLWRFAAGMTSISVLAVILTQIDKIVLSRMLSLELFGYYTLASTVALSLTRLFTPVFYSIYPRFTQLVATENVDELLQLYHKSCQFLAVLILPAATILTFFSFEVMLLWTHSVATATNTNELVSILVCGTAINGLMNAPYALQLAYGWTRLSIFKNVVAVAFLVPLTIFLSSRYGAVGAASAWLILNLGYLLIEIPVMHFRLFRHEKARWYRQDVGVPLLASLFVGTVGRVLLSGGRSLSATAVYIAVISVMTLAAVVLSVPTMRSRVLARRAT